MKKIRAFIAITLSEEIRETLARLVADVATQLPAGAVRWVKPELMHLTLRFLGDTSIETLETMAIHLEEITSDFQSFSLELGGAGCFPGKRRPRVLWVGMQDSADRLEQLKAAIDRMLDPLGWEVERKSFHAHVTLGRVRRPDRSIGRRYLELQVPAATMVVSSVHLIESKLHPTGPEYKIRYEAELLG